MSVNGSVNGASLSSQPSSESIDLSALRGPIVKDTTEGIPCPRHGKKYWLFQETGPCLHPQCVSSDLEYFASSSSYQPVFSRVIQLGVTDFIGWAVSEALYLLADCWKRDAETWKPLCEGYIKHRREDYLRGLKTETEFHEWMHSEVFRRRAATHGTKQDYPDSLVWLRECAVFLIGRFGPAVTASVFSCVEITDLARLCFDGNVTQARLAHDAAIEELRLWHDNKISDS